MMTDDAEIKQYLKEARSFDYDLRLRSDRSRRLAWMVAGVSGAIAVAACTAVAMLAPLKTVEPFVIRVDSATGVPEVMTSLSDGQEEYDEAVSKYFLARYVRVREGYSFATREAIFREVQLLSSRDEQAEFSQSYNASNPDSPQFIYGRNGKADVAIRSIAFIGEDLAQVRFARTVTQRDESVRTLWVATVQFNFQSDAIISDQDRLINPLGFIVTDYRADPEVVE
ncbi:virB8 family protein [Sulfitobacter sp. 1151]|uniref:VirB8 family protein n=2 Tax=Parasulfitobacter algicola TaxID=2614809 RepID=A0ABX2J1J8_9RHOB|nr:virB8 family protein [Sulfitobacter algicola]